MTVTEYVPAGVLFSPPAVPLQALIATVASVANSIERETRRRLLRLRFRRPTIGISSNVNELPARTTAAFTLLWIVIVVVEAAVPFGVTVAGLKEHVEFAGRFEHVKVVAALKPFTGVTVTVVVAGVPAVTDALAGETESVKSAGSGVLTVIETVDEVDVRSPLSPPYTAVIE